jgi:hypothetical protein
MHFCTCTIKFFQLEWPKLLNVLNYHLTTFCFIKWEYLIIEFSYNEDQKHYASHANYFEFSEGL